MDDPEKPTIGVVHEVRMEEIPSTVPRTSVDLREFNKDNCPADQNFGDEISSVGGCQWLSNTGISSVRVRPQAADMPSNCYLTLFEDRQCFSQNNAVIGPIKPGTQVGDCTAVKNVDGVGFVAQAAILRCADPISIPQ